jgi:hypothetical protein
MAAREIRLTDDEALQVVRDVLMRGSIGECVPVLSPRYGPPYHLADLVDALDESMVNPIRVCSSVPPRHGKTETILHALATFIHREPHRTHAFVSYGKDISLSKSRKVRDIVTSRFGINLKTDALHEWRTHEGGGLLATSIGGSLTGQGVDGVLVIDDPIKNRVEAESRRTRDQQWEWFLPVATTRIERRGSIIANGTRWHPDDLIGRLKDGFGGREPWPYLCAPALDDHGQALWPEAFSADTLAKIRRDVGEYTWWSLYQGEPRPRGGELFGDVSTYPAEMIPQLVGRRGAGVDLAYTARTSSDWTIFVAGALVTEQDPHDPARTLPPKLYLTDIERRQSDKTASKAALSRFLLRNGTHIARWDCSAIEREVVDDSWPVHVELARADKFVRAQAAAAMWRDGRVLVPTGSDRPEWNAFVDVVTRFTGVGDKQDDDVDALSSLVNHLTGGSSSLLDALSSPATLARAAGVMSMFRR